MTGLDEKADSILEVAVIITDYRLNTLEKYHAVIFQPDEVLSQMNDWCKENHGKSGLTAAVPHGISIGRAEKDLVGLIGKHFEPDDRVVLAGNSIGNDRRFIDQYWKTLSSRLHYRMIDVSSLKEIYRECYGLNFQKSNAHRALGDVEASIEELKYYLSFVNAPMLPPEDIA